jgi:hypothetical protein
MEKKEVTIEGPLKVGGVTVITIADTLLKCESSNGGAVFMGIKKPSYVVVISKSEKRAFSVSGEDISMDQIIALVPGIEALLQKL